MLSELNKYLYNLRQEEGANDDGSGGEEAVESCVLQWFVGGDDLTGDLHVLQFPFSPPLPSAIKSRMETF